MGNTCGLNIDGSRFAIAHFNIIAQRITYYRFFGVPRKSGYMHKNVIAAGIGLYKAEAAIVIPSAQLSVFLHNIPLAMTFRWQCFIWGLF